MDVQGLLGMDALVPGADSGWHDAIAASAVEDFYRILLRYMDADLRATFTLAAPPELEPELQRIAQDPPEESAAFYKALQVPYLTALLSGARQPSAKHLDAASACKQIEKLCASSATFRRHARALQALHWKKRWPAMERYLEDQRTVDYSREIHTVFDRLGVQLRSQKDSTRDSERAVRLGALLPKLEELRRGALTRKLYWASRLYGHLTTEWMPRLQARLANAHGAREVALEIRSCSALFSVLEEADGDPAVLTFHDAFLQTVRAFTPPDCLPRYVDYRGNPERFSQAVDGLFTEFKKRYTRSGIPEIEQALQQWSLAPGLSGRTAPGSPRALRGSTPRP